MRKALWGLPLVQTHQIPAPDLLHGVYLGVLKHLMDWIMLIFKKQ